MKKEKTKKGIKRNIGVAVIIIVSIAIIISSAVTYLFYQQTYQTEIDNIKTDYENQMADLNLQKDNHLEFERFVLKAGKQLNFAFLNEGFAGTFYNEAVRQYNTSNYNLAEKYYGYAALYYTYAHEPYLNSKTLFLEAEKHSTNQNELDIIDKYLEYIKISDDILLISYNRCYNFSLACYYYNISDHTSGNEYLNQANSLLNEYNNLINAYTKLNSDIESILEESWET